MSKKRISKLAIVCLLILVLCFATSCKEEEPTPTGPVKDAPGTVYVLNAFETDRDLFSIRPAIQYMSASMDIVGADKGQVKAGEGSMKYTFERGNWPDMVLHIKQSAYPDLDIANLNKMNLSVYNDNDKAVKCYVSVVVGGNKPLLSQEFDLEPKQWNDLEFRLSALACQFNADQILGFRFRMEAEAGSVFYFDQWTVTMGAENTDEDNQWEPLLLGIIDKFDKLPQELKASDYEMLRTLYMDYAKLPDVYRNIVPNYNKMYDALKAFVEVQFAAEEDALVRRFLAFDEFYGIGQISSANYTMQYQTDVKFGDQKGSIKVVFDGSTKESYFPYHSPLDPKRYDYLEISFFNDDVNRKVFYFNWDQRLVVEPQTWGTLKVRGDELIKEGNLIVDTIDAQGTRIQSSGTVYISAMYGYRRDLLSELKKLPNAAEFEMKRDIKYLTLIENTMSLYAKTSEADKANLPKDLVENLLKCYEAIASYYTVFDATQEDLEFGTPDCAAIGSIEAGEDEQYGPIWNLTFTDKPDSVYIAGFRFVKEFRGASNMFFYIYNPQDTAQTMELYADGTWKNLGMHTLEPGWNEIQIPAEVQVNYYIFGLFANTQDVLGTWKVSSLYAMTDEAVNTDAAKVVSALIEGLPKAGQIQMPDGLKYVADIWQAYEAYEKLTEDGKSRVSAELKAKLDACMKAIEGYKASINPNTDEMTVGTPDCECFGNIQIKWDETYGPVYALNITGAGTGDYAAGFQVNKDISADKNLFFYIFNPQPTSQTMYLYANPAWENMGERVLNPGWNLIELPKDAKIDRYLFALFPKNATVTGQWKITTVFSKSQDMVDKANAAQTAEWIDALPNADSITMPEDMHLLSAIYRASDSYNALSDAAKKNISKAQLDKLNACLKAVGGYRVAANALTDDMTVGTPDAPCQGIMNRFEDETYGPVFGLKITGAGQGVYAGGFQITKDMTGFNHMFFYIYNPQDSAQTMFLYADPSWKDLGARTLQPGWNKIELPEDTRIERYIFGIFPATADAVGQWKITSIYALSEDMVYGDAAAEVEAMIQALKNANALTLNDRAAVEAAQAAYEALPEGAKTLISRESKEKLEACVAKMDALTVAIRAEEVGALIEALPDPSTITEPVDVKTVADIHNVNAQYQALSEESRKYVTDAQVAKLKACLAAIEGHDIVVDATKDDITVGTADAPCEGTWSRGEDETYGPVFNLNITGAGTGDYAGGFQMTKDMAAYGKMFFYIYNPQESAQVMFLYADPSWKDLGPRTLQPGWNLIELPEGVQVERFVFGIFPATANVVGQWKVTSLYALSNELVYGDVAAEVEAMIQALKDADALTLADRAAVEAAKTAYEALPEGAKALISKASKDKLDACIARMDVLALAVRGQEVGAQIDALPEPEDIQVPVDVKIIAAIHKANNNYNALSDGAKAYVTEAQLAKLSACLQAIEGYSIAVDATSDEITVGTADAPCQGTWNRLEDATYGPAFGLNITGAGNSADYAGGFQLTKDMTGCKHMFFYIYNPQESAQVMFLYADGNWKDLGPRTLNPGWNLIELPEDISIDSYIFGIFPATADVVGQWKITSIYAMSDRLVYGEAVADVEAMIQDLKDPAQLTIEDKAAVNAAKAAYDELPDAAKALVSQENLDKLNACVARMAELNQDYVAQEVSDLIDALPEASEITLPQDVKWITKIHQAKAAYDALGELQSRVDAAHTAKLNALVAKIEGYTVVIDATTDSMTFPPDAPCQGTIGKNSESEYGPVFTLNITQASAGAYKGGFRVDKALSGHENLFFYIYNPQESAQVMWLYDNSWSGIGGGELQPGWNKIELPRNMTAQYIFGLLTSEGVEGQWLITSFYAATDKAIYADAVANVEAMIAQLKDASAMTLDDESAVLEAKAAYDALPEAAKAYVAQSSMDKLNACIAKLAQLNAASDAAAVSALIEALPAVDQLQLSNQQAVEDAKAAYDALSEEAKALISQANVDKLNDCVARIAILSEAQTVIDMIDALPEADAVELSHKTEIDNAKAAYDALSEDAKALVSQEKVDKLNACLAKIEELETPADRITPVNEAIAALPEASALTVADKDAVRAAEAAYNALPDDDKSQVVGVAKLNACIAKVNYWDALAEKIVIDAATTGVTTDYSNWTPCTPGVDNNTFGKVMSVPAGATCLAIEEGKKGEAWDACTAIGFYIYNPTDAPVNGNYCYTWSGDYNETFTLAAKSWTYIEMKDHAGNASKQFISSNDTMYIYVTGNYSVEGWLVSSFYSAPVPEMPDEGGSADVTAVENQVSLLPEATALKISDKEAVRAAETAYNALGADKSLVDVTLAAKLEACIAKVNYWDALAEKIVIDAATTGVTTDYSNWTPCTPGADNNTFGKVMSVPAGATCLAIENGKKGEAWDACTAIGFYIYNPTDNDVAGNYCYTWSGDYNETFTLKAKSWTYIEMKDHAGNANKQFISSDSTTYIYVNFSVEGWLVSSFYSAPVPEMPDEGGSADVTAVENQISLLPEATALKVSDKEAVRAAETAYNALGADKSLVDVALAAKLEACIAKVNYWDALAEKIVIDAATTGVTTDYSNWTPCAYGIDDNTFGKVMSVPVGATCLAIENGKKGEAWDACTAIGFYIYNPTDAPVNGNYCYTWSGDYNETFTLAAKSWTYIEMKDHAGNANKQFISSDATTYIYVNFSVEGWLVSSFYSAPVPVMPE